MARNIITNAFKHFNLINRHRWTVFKLCCKAGIPFRGIVHDLSKYSFTEFWESAKFYNGHLSPIPLDIQRHGFIIEEEISIIQNIGMTLHLLNRHL